MHFQRLGLIPREIYMFASLLKSVTHHLLRIGRSRREEAAERAISPKSPARTRRRSTVDVPGNGEEVLERGLQLVEPREGIRGEGNDDQRVMAVRIRTPTYVGSLSLQDFHDFFGFHRLMLTHLGAKGGTRVFRSDELLPHGTACVSTCQSSIPIFKRGTRAPFLGRLSSIRPHPSSLAYYGGGKLGVEATHACLLAFGPTRVK